MSKYHLVIDKRFCNALYQNKININKHLNVQYLEIKYVFKDYIYQKFENQYYSTIAKIISKSPLFHALKYGLSHSKIQKKLDSLSNIEYGGESGHLLNWINKVKNNPNSRVNAFQSVTKLIWNQTQAQVENDESHWAPRPNEWRSKFKLFCDYLPNLTSFTCDKIRKYEWGGTEFDDTDCIFMIFKQPYYCQILQFLDIDLASNERRRHINIENHPLYHLSKFKKLKSLKFTLPIFNGCDEYYAQLRYNTNDHLYDLMDVSIEFKSASFHSYTIVERSGSTLNFIDSSDHSVIDGLCGFILDLCPNIKSYTFLGNNNGDKHSEYDHLLRCYDKLESLETDTENIFCDDVRMISLKELTVRINAKDEFLEEYEYVDFKGFRNLEKLNCIYIVQDPYYREYFLNKYPFLITRIKEFINFIENQNDNQHLKHIGIYHELSDDINTIIKRKRTKYKMSDVFGTKDCNKESSLKLCKSIMNLLTLNVESKIESISINPIVLKQSDLGYLDFWFNNQYGIFNAQNQEIKSNVILCDLYCANQQP